MLVHCKATHASRVYCAAFNTMAVDLSQHSIKGVLVSRRVMEETGNRGYSSGAKNSESQLCTGGECGRDTEAEEHAECDDYEEERSAQ